MNKKSIARFEYVLLTVFVILTLGITAFGYKSYRYYAKHFRSDLEKQLEAISELKSNGLTQYLDERLGDGQMLFRRDSFYNTVQRFFEKPEDAENKEYLRKWLNRYAASYPYDGICLLDSSGAVRMSIPNAQEKVSSFIINRVPEIMQVNRVQFGDFYRNEYDKGMYISILVPVLGEDKNSRPLGVLVMRVNPESYIYPFVKEWPVPSETAETLLVRRDGSDVLFLSDLKFNDKAALSLRFPLDDNRELLAAKAVSGHKGIAEGTDYRGVPVVGYLCAIPNTPWFLVTRIDKTEVFESIKAQLLSLVGLSLASIVIIGTLLWFLWRRRSLIFYQRQYEMAMALKESEERYRRLFEAAKDGVLLVDFDSGVINDINPYLLELLGYPKSDIRGKYLWDIRTFKDIAASKASFTVLQAKKYVSYEDLPLLKKNGDKIEVEFVSNVYLAGGKNVIQCNIRDITGRRRLERELADAKERQYKALIENLPQKVYLKDSNSIYISCNENYAKDLGIRSEEIIGKTDHDFFPTHVAEKYRADDKRVIETGEIENTEEEFLIMKDFFRGAEKTYINTVRIPIRDKDGNVTGVCGIFWDITERKKARDTEKRLIEIIDATPDFIGFADAKDKHIVYINKSGRKMCGMSYDEDVTKLKICDLHPEWANEMLGKEILPAAARDGTWTGECAFLNIKDKYEIPVLMVLSSHKTAYGEVEFFSTISRDITERKKIEGELRVAETIKMSAEIKSKFASMVSHELRSPLAVIKESINLVLEGMMGSVTEDQKEVLSAAKSNTDRLSRLINNVLDFQKIGSGKIELGLSEDDINDTVVETSKAMNLLVSEKGLELTVDIDEEMPKIRFDRDRIVQVVTNLLSNAIKFTEKGSVSVTTRKEDNIAHVIVEDSGSGIRSDDMNKLFGTFEQLSSRPGKKRGGTGLGLAISREIIMAHNGKMWAESEFGKGSKFHFTLPIKERRA